MSPFCSLPLVLLTLLALGCGDDSDDSGANAAPISCRVESPGDALQCIEYSVPPEAAGATRDGCTAGGGTLVASCPRENRLGTCTSRVGDTLTIVTRYY